MSSKYRHRNGGVSHEGRPDLRNNSPPKNRTAKERQHHFKSIPRHELDAVDHLFDARPSYQDFHSSFVIQNDDRYPNKGRVPPTKLRDSSQHRRKTRERHESEFKSLDMNSPQRQSRMPDWINFNGHNLGKSQLSGIGRSHLNPDEFWRSEQFERSTENVEPFHQRRGSHKKRNNKNNSDFKNGDNKARSKSRERYSDSKRQLDREREFQSLAFFDFDLDHQQPPLLTSERKKTKEKRNVNEYSPPMDYNPEFSGQYNPYAVRQPTHRRQGIEKQLFHNARYPVDEPR